VAIAPPPGASLVRRYGTYVAGLVLVGVGVAVSVRAEVGVAPFDVLTTGTAAATGVPLAVTAVLVPAAFTVLGVALRGPFGPGTLVAVATVGPVIGAVLHVVPEMDHLGVRTAAFALGASVIAVGITLVVVGDVGAGPSELVMLAVHQRGIDLAVARTGIEVGCVALGWVLGGQVGAGTVVFAIAIGPALRSLLRIAGYRGPRAVAADCAAPLA
jgi:uncharacterized membrane protein YczE